MNVNTYLDETTRLMNEIREAFASSTRSCNRFAALLNRISWDETYEADGELCFIKGELSFSTESLDPFHKFFNKPSFIIGTSFIDISGKNLLAA